MSLVSVSSAPSLKLRALFLAATLTACAAIAAPQGASAADARAPLTVTVDRAQVVRIARDANTVIVGNPAIVDATVQDGRTIVLTGRSFGVTNLIVLDDNGDPVVDETVIVRGHETNTVRIYRQASRETLACAPVCEPTLTIGDNSELFETSTQQITARNALSDAAAQTR
ncbi:pilus assembly protein N-terminal domain-containing protein [Rhizobiaceae bacterium]|nr:pilus assembly protein N-terminal domain-containing protein [Rhizobiaceae bacterium]